MMKIFLEKVNYEISRAAEYLKSNVCKHPDVFRVLIESLQDSVSLFHIVTATKKSCNGDFSKVLDEAQSMLLNLESGLDQAECEAQLAALTSSSNSSGVKSIVERNLVKIPKFSGDPLKFCPFINLFTIRIEGKSFLTNIEKFLLLKNYLEGEAYDVIDEIPITEKTFALSLNVLQEMYGNEKKCLDTLFRRIEALPAASTCEIAEIRKTYWKLEVILQSLELYGELTNENEFLQFHYLKKFANVTGLEIKKLSSLQLGEIRKQVRDFMLEKEDASEIISFEKSSSNADPGIVTNERNKSETETALTCGNNNSTPSNRILECIFCLEKHYSEDCTVYASVFHRKKQIQHLCFKCLQVKHVGKPCMQSEKCNYCHVDYHNRILCPLKCRNVGLDEKASEQLSDALSATLLQDPKLASNEPLTDDLSFHPTTHLTTVTIVESPKTGKKTSVRLVIASGSRSKISESAIRRLGFRMNKNKRTDSCSNASGEIPRATNVTIKVLIHVPNMLPVPLELLVVEVVCDKTVITPTVAEFKKAHPHLVDMDFPDTGSGQPIEMIIGGDTELASVGFNCGLDDEKCPPLNRGWSLVSSMFGWIIVGIDKSKELVMFFF